MTDSSGSQPGRRRTRRSGGGFRHRSEGARAAAADEARRRRLALDAISKRRPDHDGRPQDDELRSGRGALPLAAVLDQLVRGNELNRRDRTNDAFAALREAAGDAVADRLEPLRLRGRELTVRVGSAALYQELVAFTGRAIEQRFASCCKNRGLDHVDRLSFRQTT